MSFSPDTHFPLVLPNGVPALLRPLAPEDRERITEAFRRLSAESTYLRFWTRFHAANPRFIDRLITPGPVEHATWVIILPDNNDIPGVGGGSLWRSNSDPCEAEVSFTVADEFQNQGVGTILLAILWTHARHWGITRFTADVLSTHLVMRAWWSTLGAVETTLDTHHLRLTLLLDTALLSSSHASRSLLRWIRHFEGESSQAEITR